MSEEDSQEEYELYIPEFDDSRPIEQWIRKAFIYGRDELCLHPMDIMGMASFVTELEDGSSWKDLISQPYYARSIYNWLKQIKQNEEIMQNLAVVLKAIYDAYPDI